MGDGKVLCFENLLEMSNVIKFAQKTMSQFEKTERFLLHNWKFKLVSILLICLILFRKAFTAKIILFIENYKDFLSFGKDDQIAITIIFILINTFLIGYFFIIKFNRKYLVSNNSLFINLIISIIYIYLRYFYISVSPYFQYKILNYFYFLDIIPIFTFFQFTLFFRVYISENEQTTKSGFLTDEPIELDANIFEKDSFKRKEFAEIITNKIIKTYSKTSFGIAINGKWGTGKTTFLNMLKNEVEKHENNICFDFKPWNNNSIDDINEDFFEELGNKLRLYSSQIESTTSRYLRKILNRNDDYILNSIITLFLNLFGVESKTQQFDNINEIIKKLNKKIIVFIDDLDRLDKREVVEVLKLIRNTANFNNTFFITAFDLDYVTSAISEITEYENEKYIEKIFQLLINMTDFPFLALRIEFSNSIKNILQNLEQDKTKQDKAQQDITKEDIINLFNMLFNEKLLENKRDINRFLNMFSIEYENLKKELETREKIEIFFQLRLLKFKDFQLYSKLKENLINKISKYYGIRSNERLEKLINNESENINQPKILRNDDETELQKLYNTILNSTVWDDRYNVIILLKDHYFHNEIPNEIWFPIFDKTETEMLKDLEMIVLEYPMNGDYRFFQLKRIIISDVVKFEKVFTAFIYFVGLYKSLFYKYIDILEEMLDHFLKNSRGLISYEFLKKSLGKVTKPNYPEVIILNSILNSNEEIRKHFYFDSINKKLSANLNLINVFSNYPLLTNHEEDVLYILYNLNWSSVDKFVRNKVNHKNIMSQLEKLIRKRDPSIYLRNGFKIDEVFYKTYKDSFDYDFDELLKDDKFIEFRYFFKEFGGDNPQDFIPYEFNHLDTKKMIEYF